MIQIKKHGQQVTPKAAKVQPVAYSATVSYRKRRLTAAQIREIQRMVEMDAVIASIEARLFQ